MFIDANSNEIEIETARKAALAKGKRFIAYPSEGQALNKDKAIELLQTVPFSTLIISGHNGGGSFSGEGGEFGYYEVEEALAQNPEAKKSVRTLMLLGCNTANLGQITTWKSIFPELDIIAGYDGTAPSQNAKSGLSYIEQIISKKDQLLAQDDKKDIERFVRNMDYIHHLEAGLYIKNIECEENKQVEKEYVFRPLMEDRSDRFKEFNFKECSKRVEELRNEKLPLFMKYYLGELENKSSASREELRKLYNFFHQYSFCFENESMTVENQGTSANAALPEWQTALYLRYWKETQANISDYYATNIEEGFNLIDKLKNEPGYFEELKNEKLKELEIKKEMLSRYVENWDDYLREAQELKYNISNMNANIDKLGLELGVLSQEYKKFFTPDELTQIGAKVKDLEWSDDSEKRDAQLKSLLEDVGIDQDTLGKYLDWKKTVEGKRELLENMKTEASQVSAYNIDFLIDSLKDEKIKEANFAHLKSELVEAESSILELKTKDARALLSGIELPNALTLEQFKNSSRKDVSLLAHKLEGAKIRLETVIPSKKWQQVETFSDFVNEVSYRLEPQYIPFSWHEIRSEIEPPGEGGGTHTTSEYYFENITEDCTSLLCQKQKNLEGLLYQWTDYGRGDGATNEDEGYNENEEMDYISEEPDAGA